MTFEFIRSGEAAKILIEMYQGYINRDRYEDHSNTEIESTLDQQEKILAQRNSLIKTRGKRGAQYVYLIVTEKVRDSLKLLIEKREEMGILPTNPYLFAIPNKTDSFIRGDVVMRKFANECELRDRKSFTSTGLRKYLATTMQVREV